MNIHFSHGYDSALLDILQWFDNHKSLFPKRYSNLLMFILKTLYTNRNKLFIEKEQYDFTLT